MLAERLAEEMAFSWRQGERPTAEEFLSRYEELRNDPAAALKLICEEICLRQEYGQEQQGEEVLRRFPEWRSQAEAMLNRYRASRQNRSGPGFPAAGERWTDFDLLAELGRGAYGRVFLAVEPRLANRPVVLKMTSVDGAEHLSLARLQHTYIVPLNVVLEDPVRNLRALCMPYFGGASLAHVLEGLKAKPAAERTGRDLVEALDQIQTKYPVLLPSRGPARQLLASATYVQALCWMGACLAEGLQHAHERGLVHLDVKPANVLVAADGQPMLLDFHLAQEPVQGGGLPSGWFGGTPKYMSPEQRLWATAARTQRSHLPAVDSRSDVYSLGLVLYEALGGELSVPVPTVLPAAEKRDRSSAIAATVPILESLQRHNPQVTTGLADIVHKCLAQRPNDRYPDAASLGTDLRRHLSDLPLLGVKNRSLTERWRKWRRRRPYALAVYAMLLMVLLAGFGVGNYTLTQVSQRRGDAQATLEEGRAQLHSHAYAEAARSFARGLALAEGMAGKPELIDSLTHGLHLARRGQAADQLHHLTNRIRFLYAVDSPNVQATRSLEEHCQKVWDTRRLIMERGNSEPGIIDEQQIRSDLLDLAILWASLRSRLAKGDQAEKACREGLQLLEEAEKLLGQSVILRRERQAYTKKLGQEGSADTASHGDTELVPRTAWEHFYLGRSFWGAGEFTQAMEQFDQALLLEPQDFWASFYRGQCAYRLERYEDAVDAFSICLALMPKSTQCIHNRALARTALGDLQKALLDYDRALQLDPTLAAAALNRGILHYHAKDYPAAVLDLKRALESGADPSAVHYNLALVQLAQGDRAKAEASLRRALQQGGEQPEAQDLLNRLLRNG